MTRALTAIGRHDKATTTKARMITEFVADVPHPASTRALQQLAQLHLTQ